tara:strand:- start:853 stop:2175 length:1323 start_codon:yes stop_codon:yes gene_type:complete
MKKRSVLGLLLLASSASGFASTQEVFIPADVNCDLSNNTLIDNFKLSADHLYKYSWDTFIAVNQMKNYGSITAPLWASWINTVSGDETFFANGYLKESNTPVSQRDTLKTITNRASWQCESGCLDLDMSLKLDGDEIKQLGLRDSNNNPVFFEKRVSGKWMEALWSTKETLVSKTMEPGFSFKWGSCQSSPQYAREPQIALKLGWRILDEKDNHERYLKMLDVKLHGYNEPKTLGLIAMHIGLGTGSNSLVDNQPSWTWLTFEQVDTLQNETPEGIKASFIAQDPQSCSNIYTANTPTPLIRDEPVPQIAQENNASYQSKLKAKGSVLQYYKLIGTQYPHIENKQYKRFDKNVRSVVFEPFLAKVNSSCKVPASQWTVSNNIRKQGSDCAGCHNNLNYYFKDKKIKWTDRFKDFTIINSGIPGIAIQDITLNPKEKENGK